MFKVFVAYPSYDEEVQIIERTTVDVQHEVEPIFTGDEILGFQHLVRRVPIAQDVLRHALDIVRATRAREEYAPEFTRKMLTWGAGPRAVQSLVLGGKALAVIRGRHHVAAEDVRDLCRPVLRHRIVTNYSAEAEGYTPDRIITEILEAVQPNETEVARNERFSKLLSA